MKQTLQFVLCSAVTVLKQGSWRDGTDVGNLASSQRGEHARPTRGAAVVALLRVPFVTDNYVFKR